MQGLAKVKHMGNADAQVESGGRDEGEGGIDDNDGDRWDMKRH